MNKQTLIDTLQLEPHLEGGYFRRTYCSSLSSTSLQRPLMSSIYYMLTDDSPIGYFHRNQSDIVHYWHAGSALRYFLISPQGEFSIVKLGPAAVETGNNNAAVQWQLTVPAGYWKATQLLQGEYGLLSEAVAPGFVYSDMTLATTQQIQQDFPQLWCRPPIQQQLRQLIRPQR